MGFSGPYLVISRPLDVDPKLRKPLGTCRFEGGNSQILCSITTPEVAGGGIGWEDGRVEALKGIFFGGGCATEAFKVLNTIESPQTFSV